MIGLSFSVVGNGLIPLALGLFPRHRSSLAVGLLFGTFSAGVNIGKVSPVDRALAELGLKRQIMLRIPQFLAAQTNFILTIPRRIARLIAGTANLRVLAVLAILKFGTNDSRPIRFIAGFGSW